MNRSCDHLHEELAAYQAGELEGEQARRIRDHLAGCEACRHLQRTLEHLDALTDELPSPPLPRRLTARVLAGVRQQEPEVTPMPTGEVWTPEEVAAYLKVPLTTIHRMSSRMPFFSLAGELRMRKQRLLEWIEEQERRQPESRVLLAL